MGLIPIHVYLDVPWVPYPSLYEELGFSTDLEGLPKLLERIAKMPLKELKERERRIEEVAFSHFTREGTL